MEYIHQLLGVHVSYEGECKESFPNYLASRYRIETVTIDGQGAVFVYPKSDPETIGNVIKHIGRIQQIVSKPAILIMKRLPYREREYLLREHVPFVVDGKQIYLPFMAVYLQERADGTKIPKDNMLPSAQMLLLKYIYRGCGEYYARDAAKILT